MTRQTPELEDYPEKALQRLALGRGWVHRPNNADQVENFMFIRRVMLGSSPLQQQPLEHRANAAISAIT
jgi:hypothetical protein